MQIGKHVGRAAKALLCGLLTRDPLRRLGAKGAAQIRRHAFFRPLDFGRVRHRGYTPQFVPPLIGASPSLRALDTSNFDPSFTAEDPNDQRCGTASPAVTPLVPATGDVDDRREQPAPPEQPEEEGDSPALAEAFAGWAYSAPAEVS